MANTKLGQLIDPKTEFLVVKHSYLNGNSYDPHKVYDSVEALKPYLNGRTPVLALEGDITQLTDNGEIVLTHQNFVPLTRRKFKRLRKEGIAATLEEVLEKALRFREGSSERRLVLCFEPKIVTTDKAIYETVRKLKEHEMDDCYFDSFFPGRLDAVNSANQELGTNYPRSLHLCGNLGALKLRVPGGTGEHDVITVPYPVSFGKLNEPVIYGAVGSNEILQILSEDPNCIGAYVRDKEGSGLKGSLRMLFNSISNTKKLRRDIQR